MEKSRDCFAKCLGNWGKQCQYHTWLKVFLELKHIGGNQSKRCKKALNNS
jgi:hypothetical protein